jgi:hypothetical protein
LFSEKYEDKLATAVKPADNVFELYRLGVAIAAISRLFDEKPAAEITYVDIVFLLSNASSILGTFTEDKFVPLDTCKANAVKLENLLDRTVSSFMEKWRKAEPDKRPGIGAEKIGAFLIGEIREQVRAFEYVFSAELSNASLYLVEQTGAYRTRTLIEAADAVFPKSVHDALEPDAVKDIQAAGRSLAFELPTAAGFHICRAVESTLLQYFSELKIELPDYKNIGRYIEALEKCAKEKGIDPKVLATLDQFRDLHRNPIMHPDVHLNMEEAQILFALAQSAISGIALDIIKIKSTVPVPKADTDGPLAALLKIVE